MKTEIDITGVDGASAGVLLRDVLDSTIPAERLLLRAPREADLPAIVALADNPKVSAPTASLPHPYTEAAGRAFLDKAATSRDSRSFAIQHRGGAFMGVIGLKLFEAALPELGYWLGEPYWGQGYVTEAARALLLAAAVSGRFPRLKANVLADNPGSIRVLEKCGFTVLEHRISQSERHRGRPLVVLAWSAP